MTKPNDRAYPFAGNEVSSSGLSKRELFAAMALQGLLASDVNADFDYKDAANAAVSQADALIEALNVKAR